MDSFDGSNESKPKMRRASGDDGHDKVSPTGMNDFGIPDVVMRDLIIRVRGHLASRSGEVGRQLQSIVASHGTELMANPMAAFNEAYNSLSPEAQGSTNASNDVGAPNASLFPAGNPIAELLQREASAIIGMVIETLDQQGCLKQCVLTPRML